MKIGIIGAGNMGSGLGKFWAQNGHKLMFSYSRDASGQGVSKWLD